MRRLTFDIDDDLYYAIKLYCAKHKIKTMKEFITATIKDKINQS